MDSLDGLGCIGHDHRIDRTPLGAVTPDTGGGEYRLVRQTEPCSRLGALLALCFGKRGERDKTPPIPETGAPEAAIQLVGASVVYRLGFELLAGLALEGQWEAPSHGAQCLAVEYQAGIAGIHLFACIAACGRLYAEQVGDFDC